jgi:hypothetical protein
MDRKFFVNFTPDDYKPSYEDYLYNDSHFLNLLKDPRLYFSLVDNKNKKILAFINFFTEKSKATSNKRSPFGSFQISPQVGLEDLYHFIKFVLKELKSRSIKEVRVNHYALVYDWKNGTFITNALLNNGFKIAGSSINHHIPVSNDDLVDNISQMEKRKLRNCIEAGFTVYEQEMEDLNEVFDFIKTCREERNYTLNISKKELEDAAERFPENYKIFSVYNGNQRIASTVAVKVNKKILYNFLPAASKEYKNFSPLVFLTEYLYKFCQRNSFEILDLGTSAIEGQPNFSLIEFKERMGGKPSLKFTFEKELMP